MLLIVILTHFLFVYYFYVAIRFGMGEYHSKNNILFALLPFADVIRGGIRQWKKLD